MVNFYDNFIRLCNAKGVSPSRAAIEAGSTKTSVNRWKKGSVPSDATMIKLVDYFKCELEDLTGIQKENAPAEEGEGRNGLSATELDSKAGEDSFQKEELNRLYDSFDSADRAWLLSVARGIKAARVQHE